MLNRATIRNTADCLCIVRLGVDQENVIVAVAFASLSHTSWIVLVRTMPSLVD